MNTRFAFIVAASDNYLPGLIALLNSIKIHQSNADVILISFRLPEEFLKKISHQIIKMEGKDQVKETAIERFRIAHALGDNYDSICLLDADMFLTANCDTFFEVAAKGFIVTGSNGMIINFNSEYQKKYNIDLNQDDYIYFKTHTSVPIFINRDNLDWFDTLYKSKRIDNFDDFVFLNLLGIAMEKDKKMICMPPYCFTGIHHFQMKPGTLAIDKNGYLVSETEEKIYCVHGKWWWEGWTQDLMPIMERYLKDEELGNKSRYKVLNAIETLKQGFNLYYNIGKIL